MREVFLETAEKSDEKPKAKARKPLKTAAAKATEAVVPPARRRRAKAGVPTSR
jgi:hypothetical protein